MKTLTIKNLSRQPLIFSMPHDIVCSESECMCSKYMRGATVLNRETGVKSLKATKMKLPASFCVMAKGTPGDTKEGLPLTMKQVPEVATAIVAGDIKVIEEEPANATKATPETAEEATKARLPRKRLGGDKE